MVSPEASGSGPEDEALAMFDADASSRVAAACIPDKEIDDMDERDIGAAPRTLRSAIVGLMC